MVKLWLNKLHYFHKPLLQLCEENLNTKNTTSLDTQDTEFDNRQDGKIYIRYVGYEIKDGVSKAEAVR